MFTMFNFTFEIDPKIAIVGCALERLGHPPISAPISEDLKLYWRLFASRRHFLKLANPIAKCVPHCRAAGGGLSLGNIVLQDLLSSTSLYKLVTRLLEVRTVTFSSDFSRKWRTLWLVVANLD
jgi:hypothetical protein